MTEALRAFIDGKVIYALTSLRDATDGAQSVPGYKQDPEDWTVEDITLTGDTLTRVRRQGVECDLWDTPAWCDPTIMDR